MAHPDLDRLLAMLLDASQHLLSEAREMYPIAASMSRDAKITAVGVYFAEEYPESQRVIDELTWALVSLASSEETAALGMACDVHFAKDQSSPKRDAIRVDLEHATGESVSVIVPYHWSGDVIELEAPIEEERRPEWFRPHAGTGE